MGRVAIVAFGANLGDPKVTFVQTWHVLEERFQTKVRPSSLYYTAPLVPPGEDPAKSPDYLNAAFRFETEAPAQDILKDLLEIERSFGRRRASGDTRWAPRQIDLDLIALSDSVTSSSQLTVPHPRMAERDFVLVPLAELAPDWRHPVSNLTAWDMLENLKANGAPRYIKAVHPIGK